MNIFQKAAAFFARPLTITQPDPAWTAERLPLLDDAYPTFGDKSVLGLSAAWACVRLIADTISTLPCAVYRPGPKGNSVIATDHPLSRIVHHRPNADQTAVDFWGYQSAALEMRGNAFSRILRDGGRIVGLVPVPPDAVSVYRRANGSLGYRWSEDGRSFDVSEQEMLHVRGFGGGPLGGVSTIEVARRAFASAMATERAAEASYRNGMRPSGAFSFKEFLAPEKRQQLEDIMNKRFTGAVNAGRPLVLEGGAEWRPFSINAADAQLIESRQFGIEEVCRIFGVPPHMIGHTSKSTSWGTGIEQQTLGFQIFTLRPRIKKIEQAAEAALLTPAERSQGYSIRFNFEGLLRGDSGSRARFYQTMTAIGAMTINEVRALENLPAVDGGDVPRMQSQNIPITETQELAPAQDGAPKDEIDR